MKPSLTNAWANLPQQPNPWSFWDGVCIVWRTGLCVAITEDYFSALRCSRKRVEGQMFKFSIIPPMHSNELAALFLSAMTCFNHLGCRWLPDTSNQSKNSTTHSGSSVCLDLNCTTSLNPLSFSPAPCGLGPPWRELLGVTVTHS